MYFESTNADTIITNDKTNNIFMMDILEPISIIGSKIEKHRNKQITREDTMKFNKDYNTYHSENNCRDWMLTD